MIRQCAFTGNSKPLKGCLHCHSTRSDGTQSPEDVLKTYAALGYDFVTLTDHYTYNRRNFAPGTGLIVLPGVELEGTLGEEGVHVFHIVGIGGPGGTAGAPAQDESLPPVAVRDQDEFAPYLRAFEARDNLALYCHPEWSGTPAREFERLPGLFALEIWNTGCVLENDMDAHAACWDELLRQGSRIYGVAVDDSHQAAHCGGGYVLVSAARDAESIRAALRDGAFYSSCGPVIRDFRVEDGRAILACSPCESVVFIRDVWPSERVSGNGLEEAQVRLHEGERYVRALCRDANGRQAWTNPIFLR